MQVAILASNLKNGRDLYLNRVTGRIVPPLEPRKTPDAGNDCPRRYGMEFIDLNELQQCLLENFFEISKNRELLVTNDS